MAKRYLIIFALLVLGNASIAQSAKDYSIQISAKVSEQPPQIILSWDSIAYATSYQIFKKPKNSSSWGPAMAFLGASDTMYVDNAVIVDSSYEYKMVALGVQTAYGYIHAGIKAPAIHNRGALVLLVDDFFIPSCTNQINQLVRDLSGDGWEIIRHDLPRTMLDTSIKNLIKADRQANPRVSAALIVGHLAVPYSGYIYPDGHPDHAGAWPADVYYAELDGTWSDNLVNDAGATRPQNHNIPGDGKWDQNFLPSSTELQVSRIDFYDMPAFGKTEIQMMTTYLNRAHRYKMDSLNIRRVALIDDNFGGFGGEAFAGNGWRTYAGLVGRENIREMELINSLDDSSYQWAYGCGAGSYTSSAGVGTTNDFAQNDVNGIFVQLFGSYFGDWDSQNNFLRAPLCSDVPALTSCWAGRPNWFVHHMALGENIGYTAKLMQNNNTLYTPGNFGTRYVHIALMGDLSLRTDYIKPPKNLTVQQTNDTTAFMNWVQSPDTAVLGYYVYRASSRYGNFQRISPLLTNHNFADHNFSTGTYYYQVRALKPVMTPSGGYYNLSIGALSDSINLVTNTASVALAEDSKEISIYPNPASHHITVGITGTAAAKATVRIVDITGKELYAADKQLVRGTTEMNIPVSHLPAGVYALLVETQDGTLARKWVKAD
ncbi:MAG: T9SS type A sorting domain-containing protein [Flavipsychrobacter sp.]|nr:T9SS type A sorting domain-containing protein [Flavipsychrobacter sp.]